MFKIFLERGRYMANLAELCRVPVAKLLFAKMPRDYTYITDTSVYVRVQPCCVLHCGERIIAWLLFVRWLSPVARLRYFAYAIMLFHISILCHRALLSPPLHVFSLPIILASYNLLAFRATFLDRNSIF